MEYQLIAPDFPLKRDVSAVEKVLINRGIGLCYIDHYLNTTEADLHDPAIIERIDDGVRMLIKHIAAADDIFIQVDSDCDGFTSAAVLINYLNCAFPAFVQNHIIWRLHDGKEHGLIPDTIPESVKMVIAPDSSSNDYDEHDYLRNQRGIDILVIDHHEADKISENACIINNQLCDYPNKTLSGVGMVYKFCARIDSFLNTSFAEDYRDLVALGLIADMMDLRDFETRHLITTGLDYIRNPFFRMMVEKQAFSLKGENTPTGIAFYIAPYINATVRMGSQEEKEILFESMLDFRAYHQIPSTKRGCKGQMETIVEQACRNCTNVKNRQTRARDEALEKIEGIIEKYNLLENKVLAIKLKPEEAVSKNLTGLIANQLMAKYQRPVLLLNQCGGIYATDTFGTKIVEFNTPITWEGSGRNYDKSKFDNFREFLKESELVLYAEGRLLLWP